jgi:hypothetical protein
VASLLDRVYEVIIEALPRSGVRAVLKVCERTSDQRLNRAKSRASNQSISAMTMVGNGAAYSAITSMRPDRLD